MTPTDEQISITTLLRSTQRNILINALAGTGKTTTLTMLMQAAEEEPILCLAFNKRAADDIREKIKEVEKEFKIDLGHVTVRTFNACGHRIWASAVSKLTLEERKTQNLFNSIVPTLSREDQREARESFWEVLSAVGLAKSLGYIPHNKFHSARRLISTEEYHASLPEKPTSLVTDLVDNILIESIKAAYKGGIDFNDQIYMPALFGGTFPRFPLVLVDEAQDLSPANHAMLDKLVRGRIIAVGDRWQSIYGFRGAETNGVERIKARFEMEERELSVSFRCPKAVVEAARWRVPSFKWIKDGGVYAVLPRLRAADIPDGAAILCRNNAPLFHIALNLLSAKRSVLVEGSDIGPRLIRIMRKLGDESTSKADLMERVAQWKNEKLRVSNAEATIKDMADCMKVFASFGETLGQAISYAEALFKQQGTIHLLTGHKAKGGEWDIVFHLDPWLIGDDDQGMNLRYVITTRAKQALYEIDTRNIQW